MKSSIYDFSSFNSNVTVHAEAQEKKEYPVNKWMTFPRVDLYFISCYLYEQGILCVYMGDYDAGIAEAYCMNPEKITDENKKEKHFVYDSPFFMEYAINGKDVSGIKSEGGPLTPDDADEDTQERYKYLIDMVRIEKKIPPELEGRRLFFSIVGIATGKAVEEINQITLTYPADIRRRYWLEEHISIPFGPINKTLSYHIPDTDMEIEVVLDELTTMDVTQIIKECWSMDDLNIGEDEVSIILVLHSHCSDDAVYFTFELQEYREEENLHPRLTTADAPWREFEFGKDDKITPGVLTNITNLMLRVDPAHLKSSYDLILTRIDVQIISDDTPKKFEISFDTK